MSFTTTDLIASVKRRASIPTSQNLFSNADFLALANDSLSIVLLPMLLSVREEYFVANADLPLVNGQFQYPIPVRAVGSKLRDVQLIDSGGSLRSLPRLFEEDRTSAIAADCSFGFYLVGNNVEIPAALIQSGQSLRLVHYRRPGSLVEVTQCAVVQEVDLALRQVTVSSVPTNYSTGVLCDFVKGKAGYETLAIDNPIAGISANVITFTDEIPSFLTVGDWVTLQSESPVPQIPLEMHTVLAQDVAVKCLEAMGDPKIQIAQQNLQVMQTAALNTLSPRVDGENKKVINRNSLIGNSWSRRRGF